MDLAFPCPSWFLVGRPGWIDGNVSFQVANDRLLKDLVQVVTDASDAELTELYQHSLFTLFPAIYEGWGLPVAESLRYGKPASAPTPRACSKLPRA